MEGRMSKYRQTSPERTRVWTLRSPKEQPQLQQVRKVPVVYYLCRNRHLEHPHFIEVPLSSPQGLYLRDFIDRLNVLRGKGMPAMYSWSCKRSYKNGFVWHDLCEDDMILPCHGNEYVLKGSELLEDPHSDRFHSGVNNAKSPQNPKQLQELVASSSRSQEASSSSSGIVGRETRSNQEDQCSPPLHHHHPKSPSIMSPESGARKNPLPGSSLTWTEYKVYKADGGTDASTQTDDRRRTDRAPDTCTRGVSTDDELLGLETHGSHQNQIPQLKEKAELGRDEISPPPSSSSTSSSERKTETLESLIRAEATKMNSFRILEEEELCIPLNTKLKASNVLMQLISCGSISVKDHHSFGIVPTYKPRFTQTKFHSPFFSSSIMLGELDCLSENPRLMGLRLEDKEYFSGSLIETTKHKEEQGGGLASLKRSSSYNADRLASGARVIIQSKASCDDSEGSLST
ncbi:protein SOSEKI 3 isoform X2 [Magnolia sinica]|uniref:protein SOSEKI 3 isoform X2 n=1 Tax=Magnolia sinica TaxID=86752 RepID=UPI00265995B5|nr:protein SOSEKI 3 isoform X2 [Magnolia sinica]